MTITYPPGPPQYFPGQQFLTFRRDATGFLLNLAQKYGDIVHFRVGPRHYYLFNHPDIIKDVLVTRNDHFVKGRVLQHAKNIMGEGLLTSEGAFHLRQRRLIQPIFHRKRIADYGAVMVDYANHLSLPWQTGQTIDMAREMTRLTLSIVGKTLFNAEVTKDSNEVGQAIEALLHNFWLMLLPFNHQLEKLPFARFRQAKQARQRLDTIIYRLIAERHITGDKGDLLSMLIAAQDTEGDGLGMSDKQVHDEAMTIFLAGHESTANALAWTWYLLAKHPQVMSKLHAELDHVLQGRLPTTEDLAQLSYTRMVFSESMRLYPPVWAMGRNVITNYEVNGYCCPKDSGVILSQWTMHHDPRFYPDPDTFDPQRWTVEAIATRPKFAYFPFGAGSRVCIGEQFAWMEGILIITTLAQKWNMSLMPNQTVALEPRITLRPKHGIKIILQQR